MLEVFLGIFAFTGVVLLLSAGIVMARSVLVASGDVDIKINGGDGISTESGKKLLVALADENLFLSSACGGGGTCGQCRCIVEEGGGDILPVEKSHFNLRERKEGWRLSCQVPVKSDMSIKVSEEVFGINRWTCTVRSNDNVATLIKELVLDLPEGESVDFRAGGYVQLEAPEYSLDFNKVEVGEEYDQDWQNMGLYKLNSVTDETVIRAYSMANFPLEKGQLKFNIRVEVPRPGQDIPPGRMSSYVFGLKPGDKITVYGPFGEFFAKDTSAEMIFIGGGAGMAPLRSHIYDQLLRLDSDRKISYWYGGRSTKELFYVDEFDKLKKKHPNFDWHVALSEPQPEDNWTGKVGFIHQVVLDEYLSKHDAPEDCEYYLCGPPPMLAAVRAMLYELGVPEENVLFDDFGG